jgi:2-haloacid dehalogenase
MNDLRALVFDVFGTVVDWRGSIIAEGERLNAKKRLAVDWAQFADEWRGRYGPSMARVASGELPWTNLDQLHRMSLDELLPAFGLTSLTEAEIDDLNRVWHRLKPWPDSVEGLTRLRERFTIGTLSNGNVALLVDMAKGAGLPWDVIFSAELVRAYKPAPAVYRSAPELLGLEPRQVMLVAAHPLDLRAAETQGLRTAYVPRPLELGPGAASSPATETGFDVVAPDFIALADQLAPARLAQ